MTPEVLSEKVRQEISAILGIPETEIAETTSPDTISSWDSVAHLNLVVALEEAFGIAFSPSETMELTSVQIIELTLAEKLEGVE